MMNDTQLRAFVTSKLPNHLILDTAKQLGIIRRHARFDLVLPYVSKRVRQPGADELI